jgi:hypothetical protein
MVTVTSWPLFVTLLVRGMPGMWQGRHRLILGWLSVLQALFPGRKTLAERARWTPASLTVWRLRRVLKAASWDVHVLGAWGVAEALQPLPPAKDGTLSLVGDGRVQPKRGTKNPWAHKGRTSAQQPGCFGMRFALWSATWDDDRLPVGFRLLRGKTPPAYHTEQALLREMVRRLVPPPWATRVRVEGDAASGSQENITRVRQRDTDAPARRWGLVLAMARPWKTVEDTAIKALVTPLPRTYAQRPLGPRLPGAKGRQTCWVSSTRRCRRHSGDVTVILRQKGRNVGPQPTKILGTKLAEWIPRPVV